MGSEATVAALQRDQHGLIARSQALRAGLTRSTISTYVANGRWLTIRRGVYGLAGVPPSLEQAALAVTLAVGECCWVAGRTAAQVWGLTVPAPTVIEVVTLPSQRVRLAGVVQHRSIALPIADLKRTSGVPVTSVARTIVDCVPHLGGKSLERSVDDALRHGLLVIGELLACVGRLDHGGRRRLAPLRTLLADRLPGQRPGGSRRELDVMKVLLQGGMPVPVQQHEVVVGGRRRVLDYAYPIERVGLEFDGFCEHGLIRSTFDDDRQRGNDLAVAGWLMLHFTSNSSPSHIIGRTSQALALRRPGVLDARAG